MDDPRVCHRDRHLSGPDCLCSSVPDHPDETPRLDRDFVLDRLDLIANSSRTVDTESFDPRTTLKFSNQ
ncbi:hypothetical protein L0156_07420, partial [bacterium]|nr:hypothetical protein [bacterium]